MQLTISITDTDDPAGELRALRDWLRADDDFAGSAVLATVAPQRGEMGAVTDTMNVLGGPGEAAAFATALAVWLRTRKSDIKVRVRSETRELEVSATNVDDADRVIRLALDEDP